MTDETDETDDPIISDMDAAVESVGSGLGLGIEEPDDEPLPPEVKPSGEVLKPGEAKPEVKPALNADGTPKERADPKADKLNQPVVKEPPKSWSKDKHELWKTLSPEAQDYYSQREQQFLDGIEMYKEAANFGKTFRDAISPYEPMIRAAGFQDHAQAVQALLNAQYRLTSGTQEQRKAAYEDLGRRLGHVAADPDAPAPDPAVADLRARLDRVDSDRVAAAQADRQQTVQRTSAEVATFADDKESHPYFDECADDIATLIRGGGYTLEDAYKKAVWANPVTREKEIARITTEAAAKRADTDREASDKARRATANNVRSRETRKAPTEPKGSWDDTMRDTLKDIRSRAN